MRASRLRPCQKSPSQKTTVRSPAVDPERGLFPDLLMKVPRTPLAHSGATRRGRKFRRAGPRSLPPLRPTPAERIPIATSSGCGPHLPQARSTPPSRSIAIPPRTTPAERGSIPTAHQHHADLPWARSPSPPTRDAHLPRVGSRSPHGRMPIGRPSIDASPGPDPCRPRMGSRSSESSVPISPGLDSLPADPRSSSRGARSPSPRARSWSDAVLTPRRAPVYR